MAVSSITFSGIAVPGIEDSKSLCYYHTLRLREENQFLDSETYYFQQREFYLQLWWQRSPIYSIKLPFRTGQNFPAKYSGGQDQPRPPPTGRPLLGVCEYIRDKAWCWPRLSWPPPTWNITHSDKGGQSLPFILWLYRSLDWVDVLLLLLVLGLGLLLDRPAPVVDDDDGLMPCVDHSVAIVVKLEPEKSNKIISIEFFNFQHNLPQSH